jgi:hypothetical protein
VRQHTQANLLNDRSTPASDQIKPLSQTRIAEQEVRHRQQVLALHLIPSHPIPSPSLARG